MISHDTKMITKLRYIFCILSSLAFVFVSTSPADEKDPAAAGPTTLKSPGASEAPAAGGSAAPGAPAAAGGSAAPGGPPAAGGTAAPGEPPAAGGSAAPGGPPAAGGTAPGGPPAGGEAGACALKLDAASLCAIGKLELKGGPPKCGDKLMEFPLKEQPEITMKEPPAVSGLVALADDKVFWAVDKIAAGKIDPKGGLVEYGAPTATDKEIKFIVFELKAPVTALPAITKDMPSAGLIKALTDAKICSVSAAFVFNSDGGAPGKGESAGPEGSGEGPKKGEAGPGNEEPASVGVNELMTPPTGDDPSGEGGDAGTNDQKAPPPAPAEPQATEKPSDGDGSGAISIKLNSFVMLLTTIVFPLSILVSKMLTC